jgi:hypothetical protein
MATGFLSSEFGPFFAGVDSGRDHIAAKRRSRKE